MENTQNTAALLFAAAYASAVLAQLESEQPQAVTFSRGEFFVDIVPPGTLPTDVDCFIGDLAASRYRSRIAEAPDRHAAIVEDLMVTGFAAEMAEHLQHPR